METALAITIVTGLTEVVKRAFRIPSRFAPFVSVTFGLVIMVIGSVDFDSDTIITGIVVGLSASGLYSGVKSVTKG